MSLLDFEADDTNNTNNDNNNQNLDTSLPHDDDDNGNDDNNNNFSNDLKAMERQRLLKYQSRELRKSQLQADYWRYAQLHHLRFLASEDYDNDDCNPLAEEHTYSLSLLCSTSAEKQWIASPG